jgi:hypothetical protein
VADRFSPSVSCPPPILEIDDRPVRHSATPTRSSTSPPASGSAQMDEDTRTVEIVG